MTVFPFAQTWTSDWVTFGKVCGKPAIKFLSGPP